MAFLVKTTFFNGYRCSCCHSKWTSEAWFENFADAEKELPKTYPSYEDVETDFVRLLSVVIHDGKSGEIVAKGELYWDNTSRSTRYKGHRWFGHIYDELFEDEK